MAAAVCVPLLLLCRPALAADVEAGRARYALCASCHGGDGRSTVMPQYPKIAGQNAPYTASALKAYREGRRGGTFAALMAETAKSLSDEDISNLAAYIATLDRK
nr:c-type cytochrome [Delftia tsuruhatensis]